MMIVELVRLMYWARVVSDTCEENRPVDGIYLFIEPLLLSASVIAMDLRS